MNCEDWGVSRGGGGIRRRADWQGGRARQRDRECALPHEQKLRMLCYGSGYVHQTRCGDQMPGDFERDDLHREVMRTQGRLTERSAYDPPGRKKVWQWGGSSIGIRSGCRVETIRIDTRRIRSAGSIRGDGVLHLRVPAGPQVSRCMQPRQRLSRISARVPSRRYIKMASKSWATTFFKK